MATSFDIRLVHHFEGQNSINSDASPGGITVRPSWAKCEMADISIAPNLELIRARREGILKRYN